MNKSYKKDYKTSLPEKGQVGDYLEKYSLPEQDNMACPAGSGRTIVEETSLGSHKVARYVNEFWTSKQRQSSSIHEISYRACFKAQLPRFFIELFSLPGNKVYDPFSGRGTTVIEAALLGRKIISNDVNPLSAILTRPRLSVPAISDIEERLRKIPFKNNLKAEIDLSMFYHPQTESEIIALKEHLKEKKDSRLEDDADRWIRMIATNRLTGHSPGFFSVYTLPPNQAVSAESQVKINQKRGQHPEYRDTRQLILRKTKALLKGATESELENLRSSSRTALFLEQDAGSTAEIADETVNLTVTSPPFLDIVQYSRDNWLRCWFNDIDPAEIEKKITMSRTVEEWSVVMERVFHELHRITRPHGWVAFEVGEVRKRTVNLEEYIVEIGLKTGFSCYGIVVNIQEFTKTSNIWGVRNNTSGTNSNRIVLFCRD